MVNQAISVIFLETSDSYHRVCVADRDLHGPLATCNALISANDSASALHHLSADEDTGLLDEGSSHEEKRPNPASNLVCTQSNAAHSTHVSVNVSNVSSSDDVKATAGNF